MDPAIWAAYQKHLKRVGDPVVASKLTLADAMLAAADALKHSGGMGDRERPSSDRQNLVTGAHVTMSTMRTMNINSFRRWLKAKLASFDDETEYAADRADETVLVIQQAEKIAIELGLPEIAHHCATVTTTMLALPAARLVLCECLALLPKDDPAETSSPSRVEATQPDQPDQLGLFTVAEAAKLLKVSQDTIYSLCSSGGLHPRRIGGDRGLMRFTLDDLRSCLKEPGLAQSWRSHAIDPLNPSRHPGERQPWLSPGLP